MLPNYMDIIKLRKKYNMSTRDLASALYPNITSSWINKVENNNLSPTYNKIKKIADYFEKVEQKKGIAIGKITQKIISFEIGDDIKKINTKMSEKGISQVLIKQEKEHLGILTDKIILRILALEIKNPKVIRDFLDPLPPKIQHDDTINKVMSIFDLYSYIFVEKNGDVAGIVTRQDMIDAGFRTKNS
jgi:predicted transcriptional regulator